MDNNLQGDSHASFQRWITRLLSWKPSGRTARQESFKPLGMDNRRESGKRSGMDNNLQGNCHARDGLRGENH